MKQNEQSMMKRREMDLVSLQTYRLVAANAQVDGWYEFINGYQQ